MKKIIVVRHGNSEFENLNIPDYKRKLLKNGIKESEEIALLLKDKQIIPEAIFSSTAFRAMQTAEIFSQVLNFPKNKIVEEGFLFGFYKSKKLLDYLQENASDKNTVMIVGHNPTLESLASNFAKDFYEDLGTSAVVAIEFGVNKWVEIRNFQGKIVFFEQPDNEEKNIQFD